MTKELLHSTAARIFERYRIAILPAVKIHTDCVTSADRYGHNYVNAPHHNNHLR